MRKPVPTLTVASVPAAHPYVTGLGLPSVGVAVLPDPPVPGAPPGQWWPPAMVDPRWIRDHRDAFDVMHIHFGTESLDPARLAAALSALREVGRPLVHTVHDLEHPQLSDQSRHLEQLALLVDAADALITLTPCAATVLERRFGRRATVIPHPAIRAPGPPESPARPAGPPVVGVHLRDLRPGTDGPGTVATLRDALGGLPEVRGRVFRHLGARDPVAAAAVDELCATSASLELVVAPRPDDATLERRLGELSVALLPVGHLTHSGWLELCVDLGVPVAAPAIGCLADQHPEAAVRSFMPGDASSLRAALRELLLAPGAVAGSPGRAAVARERAGRRAREALAIQEAHLLVYRGVHRG